MHAIEEDHLLEFLKDRGVETNLETVAVEPEKALHAVHVSTMSLRECCVSEPDVLGTIKLRAELIGPVAEASGGGSHLPYTFYTLELTWAAFFMETKIYLRSFGHKRVCEGLFRVERQTILGSSLHMLTR